MNMLLAKIFIKDYKNTQNAVVRKAYGIMTGIVGIICNVLLSAAKVICGILFSSIAILADGLNNLSDAGSSVVSIVGFKIANRPADKEHPFGHARLEYISGMIVSFIILFLGLQLVISSVDGIITPTPAEFNYVLVGVLGAGILIKLGLALFNRRAGKLINSATLKATAIDSLCDVIASAAVLISLFIFRFTGFNLDAYMGLLVAAFIIFSGVKTLKETMSPLLGEKPNKELVEKIYKGIHSYENVLGIHDLVIHNYGHGRNFASVHVEVDSKRDILDSHELIDKIENDFGKQGIHLVIHLDPVVTDDENVTNLKALTLSTLAEISPTLSMHDFRVVLGKSRTNLIFDIVVPVEYKCNTDSLQNDLQSRLQKVNPTLYVVVAIDKNYCL